MSLHAPYLLYAQIVGAGQGPVVVGEYPDEATRRRAYNEAMRRLADGGYSDEVKDFALGEDPEFRKSRQAIAGSESLLELFGGAGDTQTAAREPDMGSGSGYTQGEFVFAKGLSQ